MSVDLIEIKMWYATLREHQKLLQEQLNDGDYSGENERLALVGEIASLKEKVKECKALFDEFLSYPEAVAFIRQAILRFELTDEHYVIDPDGGREKRYLYRTDSKFAQERMRKALRTVDAKFTDVFRDEEDEDYLCRQILPFPPAVLLDIQSDKMARRKKRR